MPHGTVTETMPVPSEQVFDILHNYDRRLEWDTLLKSASLCDGATEAGLHVKSVCTGRWYLGSLSLQTEYITFKPADVAAVKLVNRPAFFESFAASIRHQDLVDGTSRVTYSYHFTARPWWLRGLLHSMMSILFRWETQKRLHSLRRYLDGPSI